MLDLFKCEVFRLMKRLELLSTGQLIFNLFEGESDSSLKIAQINSNLFYLIFYFLLMVKHKRSNIAYLMAQFPDITVTVSNAGMKIGLDEFELIKVSKVAVDKFLSLLAKDLISYSLILLHNLLAPQIKLINLFLSPIIHIFTQASIFTLHCLHNLCQFSISKLREMIEHLLESFFHVLHHGLYLLGDSLNLDQRLINASPFTFEADRLKLAFWIGKSNYQVVLVMAEKIFLF